MEWRGRNRKLWAHLIDMSAPRKEDGKLRTVTGAEVPPIAEPAREGTPKEPNSAALEKSILEGKIRRKEFRSPSRVDEGLTFTQKKVYLKINGKVLRIWDRSEARKMGITKGDCKLVITREGWLVADFRSDTVLTSGVIHAPAH